MRFEIHFQTDGESFRAVSAFYLKKQKRFIPKMALAVLIFSEGFETAVI